MSYLCHTKEGEGAQPQTSEDNPKRFVSIMKVEKCTPEEAIKLAEKLVAEIRDFEERSGIDLFKSTMADFYTKFGRELEYMISDLCYQYPPYMYDMVKEMINGEEPEIVTAWRYGKVPERGTSYNYRDQEYEKGVSVLPYDGGKESAYYKAFFGGAPLIRVRGIDFGYKGSDGEPLLFAAEEITD